MIRAFVLRAGSGAGVLAVLVGLAGCGSEAKLVPADGVLKIGGKPAANISVQFLPEGGPTSYATTDAEGKFRLKTYDGRDGAVPGAHAVVLADLDEERPPQGKPLTKPSRVALKYVSAGPDGLRAEVPPEGGSVALDVPAAGR